MLDIIWEKIADEWFMGALMGWVLLISMLVLHLQEVVDWINKDR